MQIEYFDAINIINDSDDIYIITHQSPDGDTIGAGFSLYYLLTALGKRSKVICPDDFPERYEYMYEDYVEKDFEAKCVIAVDVADEKLMGTLAEVYGDKVDLCIDHHVSNTEYARKTLLCSYASATCEVMYELITRMDVKITESMAKCIYTGIATDTGCFKYENTSARAHEIVAALKTEHKLKYAAMNRILFDIKSEGRIRLEAVLINTMETYLDNRCTLVCITKEFMNTLNLEGSELEGVTAVAMQIEGVEVGVTMKEREPDVYKVSMRSANDVNVSEICKSLGGGGHVKAAGCLVKAPLEEAKRIIVEAVAKGMDKLA